ncbi:uncharacterized protein SCHCODRAFT_01304406 [Schizophyllum commune H4-8]|uniref:uncharacterized protein n=1 Tax=Schizophyllum commune (strain H4-8 / FGSC 9210) TaxID=578458 RepID=UPI002160449D|nr:uncharacterized protein SCHCODRAFT_01304406 [Schizophyllum commune H4-8]KAI5892772.1 hypothetical protein SCHCODRAFT_01304406 [Schizophyllum commune H4-8]
MKRMSVSVHNGWPRCPNEGLATESSNLEPCPPSIPYHVPISRIPNRPALHCAIIVHSSLPVPYSTASRPSRSPRPGRPRQTAFHLQNLHHLQTTLRHFSCLHTRCFLTERRIAQQVSAPAHAPAPSPTLSPAAPDPFGSTAATPDRQRRRP